MNKWRTRELCGCPVIFSTVSREDSSSPLQKWDSLNSDRTKVLSQRCDSVREGCVSTAIGMDVLKFSEYYIVERKIVHSGFTLSGDSFVHDSWGANGVKRKSFK